MLLMLLSLLILVLLVLEEYFVRVVDCSFFVTFAAPAPVAVIWLLLLSSSFSG